jgi:DNA polymerase elongation subunit (family B)
MEHIIKSWSSNRSYLYLRVHNLKTGEVRAMAMIYLDIETYSRQQEPQFNDKIITIQYSEAGGNSEILKEWESSEKTFSADFMSI